MTQNRWGFPLIIIAVLIITSLLTVIFPAVTRNITSALTGSGGNGQRTEIAIPSEGGGQELVEVKVDGYLLGEELVKIPFLGEYNAQEPLSRTYGSLGLLGIITAIVIGGLIAFTIPIVGLVWLSNRSLTQQAEDKTYDAALTGLTNRIDAELKEENKAKPVTGKPETHYRPLRDGWAAGLMIISLAYLFGYVLGEGISIGLGRTVANVFFILSAIGSYFYFRPARIEAIDKTEYGGFNRGLVWVFLSGALMMGLGIGLMYIVISGGDPFPWIEWTPGPRIDWAQLQQWFDDSGLRISEWN